jgi:hypothetical protein
MRGIRDIFFLKRGKIVTCKRCKCRYEIPQKTHWLLTLLIYVILIALGTVLFIFFTRTLDTFISKMFILKIVISVVTPMIVMLFLASFIFTILSSVKKIDNSVKEIKSFLTFKCQECGHKIWKTRGIRDIFFFKEKNIAICKECGCKYKISNKITFLPSFFVEFTTGFFLLFMFLANLAAIDALFPKMNGFLQFTIAIAMTAVIWVTLFEFIFATLSSIDKINDKE